MKVLIESCQNENKRLTSANYTVVKKAIRDPLLCTKLTFMLSVAEELEPFLVQFQSDTSMLPFLGISPETLLRFLMSRIIKKEMRTGNSPLKSMRIDMDQPVSIFSAPKIDLGFATTGFVVVLETLKNP